MVWATKAATWLLLVGQAICAQAETTNEARQAATLFVHEYLSYSRGSIAHSVWLHRWAKTMTPNLAGLVEGAILADRNNSCKGPPMIEGDLLTSVAEGPTEATIGQCAVKGYSSRCVVQYTLQGSRDLEAYRWNEQIGLQKVDNVWLVSEYVQAESWREEPSFAGKLKQIIRQASVCE